ncbi:MAG: hypothetical protein D6770_08665 [Anaerolineae bacterium]|nr:MAG: hypothetical protein D6770_08665 [Anaerolineae bacterium]
MTRRDLLTLFLVGLGVGLAVAAFQSTPGYMDAEYYFATGRRLAEGHGFTEPFLWNYLDDPAGLPHPSHAYWMPLASLLSALGMAVTGRLTYAAGRWPFLLLTASLPPLTARLAFSLTARRDLAWTSGLLAVFPAFYAPYLPVTDTFSPVMFLGALFFLVISLDERPRLRALTLGLLAGFFHLARADGLIWLLLALGTIWLERPGTLRRFPADKIALVLGGYALVMGAWMARNLSVFGTVLAPGGSRALWMTRYDELFAYPANRLTFATWWQAGVNAAVRARLWALNINAQTAFAVQGGIVLFPLILAALRERRADRRVRLALLAWGLILTVMTFIFPFAGARGGFFHSGAALQPLWWALAPLGLERFIAWGTRRRGWAEGQARRVFQGGLIALVALLTIVIAYGRVVGPEPLKPQWDAGERLYRRVEERLRSLGAPPEVPIVVSNPPGYYLASGRPAIALPDGDVETLQAVAARYGARYVLLDPRSTPRGLASLLEDPATAPGLRYLDTLEEVVLFAIP